MVGVRSLNAPRGMLPSSRPRLVSFSPSSPPLPSCMHVQHPLTLRVLRLVHNYGFRLWHEWRYALFNLHKVSYPRDFRRITDIATGPSRCFPFWQELLACYVLSADSANPKAVTKCVPELEDYHEYLHHRKEVSSGHAREHDLNWRNWQRLTQLVIMNREPE